MDDATLGFLVEDMNACHVDSNVYNVTCTGLTSGRYASDKVGLVSYEVEIDLSAHKLCNFNVSLDDSICHSADVSLVVMDTLGTDTDNNFLTNIFLKLRSLSLVLGKLEGVGTECT